MTYIQNFRGRSACPCQVIWLLAFEAEAQRRGILDGLLPLSQLIGGAKESGGTHSSGGADDTYPLTSIRDVGGYVWLSRQMGADATWERPTNWDGRGGVRHVHRVLTGCPHNGPAAYQIDAVRAGFNGLGAGGRGAPDDGPRPLSGRTWREGVEWAQQQQEEAEMTPAQEKKLDDVVGTLKSLADTVEKMQDREQRRDERDRARDARIVKLVRSGNATAEQILAELVPQED